MISPYKGKFKVTSPYGNRTMSWGKEFHDGLDLVGLDSKNVYSTIEGKVDKAGWENALNHKQGYGQYVRIIKTGTEDHYYFAHLSKIHVKKGQKVKVGDLLGVEGSTGLSTGSHCHYGVRTNASKSKHKNISTISGIPNKVGTYKSVEVKYQVLCLGDKTWLPNVNGKEDYAGKFGESACCVYASLTEGDIYYKVHVKDKEKGDRWLPEVKNRTDYAGLKDKPIDGIMFKVKKCSKKIKYRVHIKGGEWLPAVSGYSKTDKTNGYAGIIGKEIDGVQVWLE